jgi:FkbM family methyltransferase
MSALLLLTGCHRWLSFSHNGSRLRLRTAGLSRLLWRNPETLLEGEVFIWCCLRADDVVVDVGANIGVHTLLAARIVGDGGRVLSLEAHPATHAALVENTRLNRCRNVKTLNVAVGPVEGIAHLSDFSSDDENKVEATGVITVTQQPLDALCQDLHQIDLLKIDIEGYELPALMGAERVLARTHCIVLEYWQKHAARFGYGFRELLQFMTDRSFHGYLLHEQGDKALLYPVSTGHVSPSLENYVFVRDEHWVRKRLRLGEQP